MEITTVFKNDTEFRATVRSIIMVKHVTFLRSKLIQEVSKAVLPPQFQVQGSYINPLNRAYKVVPNTEFVEEVVDELLDEYCNYGMLAKTPIDGDVQYIVKNPM